jgi:hypothetical protein
VLGFADLLGLHGTGHLSGLGSSCEVSPEAMPGARRALNRGRRRPQADKAHRDLDVAQEPPSPGQTYSRHELMLGNAPARQGRL